MMLSLFLGVCVLVAAALVVRPGLGGKPYAFVALLLLPLCASFLGLSAHIEHSKQTSFCISCHVMEKHGKSLLVEDATLLAATHYQGGRLPREEACYTCHTTYTMYGPFTSKLRGLQHVWVNYFGKAPKKLKLYEPYNNRECLHCHDGAQRFMTAQTHNAQAGRMDKMRANQASCVASGCHDAVHDADELDGLPLWKLPGDKS